MYFLSSADKCNNYSPLVSIHNGKNNIRLRTSLAVIVVVTLIEFFANLVRIPSPLRFVEVNYVFMARFVCLILSFDERVDVLNKRTRHSLGIRVIHSSFEIALDCRSNHVDERTVSG